MGTSSNKEADELIADKAAPVKAKRKVDWRKKVKPVRRPVSGWAVILCAIGLFLSLAALAAGYFGGVWVPLDAFSHLRVHFAGAAIGFALAIALLFLLRRKRYGAIALVLAAVGTVLFAGLWPAHILPKGKFPATAPGEVELRMVSYNIWGRNRDSVRIAEFLKEANADVIVLMEFFAFHRPALAALKTEYPHQYECSDIKDCNLAILSRRPFVAKGAKAGWDGPVSLWVRFGDELKGLTVFGAHFMRPDTPNRQWRQIKALAGETFSAPGPIIVAGDFNAAPGSIMLLGFQEFAGLWRVSSLPTWPSWFFNLPQLAIDHVFISNGVRPLAYPKPGKDAGSDHLPLISSFAISGSSE